MIRLDRLQPLDIQMLFLYLGLSVWGIWAQVEPPLSLLGASGEALTRIVTLGVLLFSLASAVGLVIDAKACEGKGRVDIELPALIGLTGSWLIYVTTIWALIAGHGNPNGPPTLGISGVLVTVFTIPFAVRFGTLVLDGIKTMRKARLARAVGIVDGAGNVL